MLSLPTTLLVAVMLAGGPESPKLVTPAQSAKDTHEAARRAYNVGDLDAAVKLFEQYYRITGDPVGLYNRAQSLRLQGHTKEAIAGYKLYLKEEPNSSARQTVERILRELEQESVKPQQKGASDITEPTEKLPTAPIPAQHPISIPQPPQARAKSFSMWSKAAIASTVILTGATIYAGLKSNSGYDSLQSTCAKLDTGCSDSQVNGLRQKALVTNILLGGTIAAATVSGILVYGDLTNKEIVVAFNRRF